MSFSVKSSHKQGQIWHANTYLVCAPSLQKSWKQQHSLSTKSLLSSNPRLAAFNSPTSFNCSRPVFFFFFLSCGSNASHGHACSPGWVVLLLIFSPSPSWETALPRTKQTQPAKMQRNYVCDWITAVFVSCISHVPTILCVWWQHWIQKPGLTLTRTKPKLTISPAAAGSEDEPVMFRLNETLTNFQCS